MATLNATAVFGGFGWLNAKTDRGLALPSFSVDGALTVPRIPQYVADSTLVVTGIWLPGVVVEQPTRTYFFLPTYIPGATDPAASFAGAGALTATSTLVSGGYTAVTFAGAGGFAVSETYRTTPALLFAGAGSLTSNPVTVPRMAASFAGTGGFYATSPAPSAYSILPDGGFTLGGAAGITESLPFIPTGGFAWTGTAVSSEHTPFTATGGMKWGGTTTPLIAFSIVPTGGEVFGGSATLTMVYAPPAPTGGVGWSGAATVSTYSAWHQATGGVVWTGTAVSYLQTAAYPSTTENPLSEPFYGWTINADNGAVSRYYRLPANSFCQFNGKTYVATAGGIYEYGADDDAGADIRASVQWPKTDFGDSRSKRMDATYFGLRLPGTGRVRLKALAAGAGQRFFPIVHSGDFTKGTVLYIGKGLQARYWTFRLDNVAGSDFELDSAELPPVLSHHRHGA